MYIHPYLFDLIQKKNYKNKVLVIYGPRRIGKTTLLAKLLEEEEEDYLLMNGEDIETQRLLSSQSIEKLKALVGNYSLLAIDEAQKVPHIGLNLKLIVDHCPNIRVIATGSSSFDLANNLGEPLTGRKITFHMYPLSQLELSQIENPIQTQAKLEERLIYGSYPEVILTPSMDEKKEYLRELVSSYLYKDLLQIEGLKKSSVLVQILQMLAFQVGKEVSHQEIGQQVGLNKITIGRYLDLLEKAFILINIRGFSRNLRKEITKKSRYYFYDVGVRNALINQFNPIHLRNDIGEIWENYIVVERLKAQEYKRIHSNNYFWRTYNQQEIDWVEEREGKLFGYEIKWQNKNSKPPSDWKTTYPESTFSVIHSENYLDFITGKF